MTNPVVHIDRFREIFPHLSSEVIETVVRQHQCLYEPSLNALLMLSDPDFRPEAVQNNLRQQPVGEQETTPQVSVFASFVSNINRFFNCFLFSLSCPSPLVH